MSKTLHGKITALKVAALFHLGWSTTQIEELIDTERGNVNRLRSEMGLAGEAPNPPQFTTADRLAVVLTMGRRFDLELSYDLNRLLPVGARIATAPAPAPAER